MVKTLQTLRPGILRFWAGQLGDTLDNLIAKPFEGNGPVTRVVHKAGRYFLRPAGVPAAVRNAGRRTLDRGPATFSPTDAANLIEYLAGSGSTPYGAKANRPGPLPLPGLRLSRGFISSSATKPGTAEFKGGTIEYRRLTASVPSLFAAMRGNASYLASSLDLVFGGQAVLTGTKSG